MNHSGRITFIHSSCHHVSSPKATSYDTFTASLLIEDNYITDRVTKTFRAQRAVLPIIPKRSSSCHIAARLLVYKLCSLNGKLCFLVFFFFLRFECGCRNENYRRRISMNFQVNGQLESVQSLTDFVLEAQPQYKKRMGTDWLAFGKISSTGFKNVNEGYPKGIEDEAKISSKILLFLEYQSKYLSSYLDRVLTSWKHGGSITRSTVTTHEVQEHGLMRSITLFSVYSFKYVKSWWVVWLCVDTKPVSRVFRLFVYKKQAQRASAKTRKLGIYFLLRKQKKKARQREKNEIRARLRELSDL